MKEKHSSAMLRVSLDGLDGLDGKEPPPNPNANAYPNGENTTTTASVAMPTLGEFVALSEPEVILLS